MADIDVERKSGNNWIWWLLGLIVLGLLLWWLLAGRGDDDADLEPVTATAVEPLPAPAEPMPAAEGATLAAILANPAQYVGTEFSGQVQVVEVPTDRGFWIEQDGTRMYALIVDGPAEQPLDINPGQMVQIDRGMVRDSTALGQLPGDPLDDQTRTTASAQPAFLVVDESQMNITQAGTPQPGTDPAPTAPGT